MYPDYRRTAEQRLTRTVGWLMGAGILLGLGWLGFLVYVVVHFVHKFW